MLNAEYGGVMSRGFEAIESIEFTPSSKFDGLIQVGEKERLRVFSKTRGKMNQYLDLGFVLQVNPFASLIFLLTWAV